MSTSSSFGRWNKLRLQWKLGLAFLALAPLIAAAGGGGLYFIKEIGASVGQIDSVAQPLASSATQITEQVDNVLVGLVSLSARADRAAAQRVTNAIEAGEASTKQQFST